MLRVQHSAKLISVPVYMGRAVTVVHMPSSRHDIGFVTYDTKTRACGLPYELHPNMSPEEIQAFIKSVCNRRAIPRIVEEPTDEGNAIE